jgi:hypothetical protein
MSKRRKPSLDLDLINSKSPFLNFSSATPKKNRKSLILKLDSTRHKPSKILVPNEKTEEIKSLVDSFLKIRYTSSEPQSKIGEIESRLLSEIEEIINEKSKVFHLNDFYELQKEKTKKILKVMEKETKEFDLKFDELTEENLKLKKNLAKLNYKTCDSQKHSISYVLGICKLREKAQTSENRDFMKNLINKLKGSDDVNEISEIVFGRENEIIADLSSDIIDFIEEGRIKSKDMQIKLKIKKKQTENLLNEIKDQESKILASNNRVDLLELAETWTSPFISEASN